MFHFALFAQNIANVTNKKIRDYKGATDGIEVGHKFREVRSLLVVY